MSSNVPTQIDKEMLRELERNNSSLLKNRNANKAVNDIKYGVLQENNLGNKIFVYEYFFDCDNNSIEHDEYFSDILEKLVRVFTDLTITYTLKKTNTLVLYNSANFLVDENLTQYSETRNNYLYDPRANITVTPDGINIIENIITIDWS